MSAKLKKPVTTRQLEELVRRRFEQDYFLRFEVQGVKGNGRLDAIAVRPSWAKQEIHGIEIKASRSDFLKDDKWPNYLPSCKQFWLVTAPGVMMAAEVPEEAGWLEASANGARLFMRKKAPNRKIDPDDECHLMKRLLFGVYWGSRRRPHEQTKTRAEELADWVAKREDDLTLSQHVSAKVRRMITHWQVEHEGMQLKVKGYEQFREALASAGITDDDLIKVSRVGYSAKSILNQKAPELMGYMPNEIRQIRFAIKALSQAAQHFESRGVNALDQIQKTDRTGQGKGLMRKFAYPHLMRP